MVTLNTTSLWQFNVCGAHWDACFKEVLLSLKAGIHPAQSMTLIWVTPPLTTCDLISGFKCYMFPSKTGLGDLRSNNRYLLFERRWNRKNNTIFEIEVQLPFTIVSASGESANVVEWCSAWAGDEDRIWMGSKEFVLLSISATLVGEVWIVCCCWRNVWSRVERVDPCWRNEVGADASSCQPHSLRLFW